MTGLKMHCLFVQKLMEKGVFPYIDGFQVQKETDEETDEDTDEEIDTTIMPELESEESAVERRNHPGKG